MSVSNEFINVLDALAEKFGMVIDWTSVNVIPYFKTLQGDYINYKIVTSIIWLLFGIICLLAGKYGVKQTKRSYEEQTKYYEDIAFVTGVVIVIGIVVIMWNVLGITTCLTFPEKLFLEELKMYL